MSPTEPNPSNDGDNASGETASATGGSASSASHGPGHSPLWLAARRALRQPRFVVASLVLAVCAVGLNGATQFLQLHFRKLAVPLPCKSLTDEATGIPSVLGEGRWAQLFPDEPIDSETEAILGTKNYLFRDYLDTRIDPHVSRFKNISGKRERMALMMETQERFRDRVPLITMSMTYFTGLVDTVAHVPDRCYVADGYEPSAHTVVAVEPDAFLDHKPRKVDFRLITFEDQTGMGRVTRNVGYFFQVNGVYENDPLEVRRHLQGLREKYGYYAKIEMMVSYAAADAAGRSLASDSQSKAADAMKDFIAASLPDIEKRLPDWERVTAGN